MFVELIRSANEELSSSRRPLVSTGGRLVDDVRGKKRNMSRAAHPGNQHTNYSCKYAVRHCAS